MAFVSYELSLISIAMSFIIFKIVLFSWLAWILWWLLLATDHYIITSCYYYSLCCAHNCQYLLHLLSLGFTTQSFCNHFYGSWYCYIFHAILQSLLNAGNLHIDNNELLSLIAGCCNHHMVSCVIIHFVNNVINYYCSKIVSENNWYN